jgi:putative ABC transport system permease protein
MDNKLTMRRVSIDADFVSVFGVKILSGRNFINTDYNPDWNKLHNILVNEMAAKQLGYTSLNDALGKQISLLGRNWDIIGVINNFHQKSLRHPLEPTIFIPSYGTDNPLCIKVDTKDLASTMAAVKAKYDAFFPGNFYDYYFLDEKFNRQYNDDQLFGKVFAIFSAFAIFIACLGLLGLSLFATIQRTKEIGVRKVLGASVSNIVMLLSKDFIRLVMVAFIIASPVAWLIMNNWLKDFAYRINISAWIFIAAGLLSMVVALATISYQAIKAAVANPVRSLRSE